MIKAYTRLTLAEREEISRSVAAGHSLRAIARRLGRAPSTISRELRRAGLMPQTYRAAVAHRDAARASSALRRPRQLAVNGRLRAYVRARLAQCWSPEQIAKRLVAEYPDDATMRISHEAIYTYLYVLPRGALKQELLASLRQSREARRSRRRSHDRRGIILDMISIEERSAEVAARPVPGHWEGDLLLGRRQARRWGCWWSGRPGPRSWSPCGPGMPPVSDAPLPGRCGPCRGNWPAR